MCLLIHQHPAFFFSSFSSLSSTPTHTQGSVSVSEANEARMRRTLTAGLVLACLLRYVQTGKQLGNASDNGLVGELEY